MTPAPDPRYPIGRFIPPADTSAQQRDNYIDDLRQLPGLLRKAVAGLTEDKLNMPYRKGGWTVRQVVHHLADSHMNGYIRFKLAVTEDAPTVKTYDEVRWAELPDANGPIDVSLRLLQALHLRWVHFLSSLTDEDFQRTFRHPEEGVVSLCHHLANYSWHGRHHVAHFT